MPVKKENPDRTYQRPVVKISLIESDSRLGRATATLNESATAAQREQTAAVEEQRKFLAPEITKARTALDTLREWEKDSQADLKQLQLLDLNAFRGKFHDPTGLFEAARVNVQNRVRDFSISITQTRELLSTIKDRIERLTFDDVQPRVWMQDSRFPGILDRDGWMPRVPTMIRLDVFRGVNSVAGLEKRLAEVKATVENFAAMLQKKEQQAGNAPKTTVTAIPPEELAARAAGRPQPLQESYGGFSGYESERRKAATFEIDE